MARVAGSSTRQVDPPWFAAQDAPGATIPSGAQASGWSIDDETVDASWYESSRLLQRGLQVVEDPPPEAIPPEWQWRWWLASRASA